MCEEIMAVGIKTVIYRRFVRWLPSVVRGGTLIQTSPYLWILSLLSNSIASYTPEIFLLLW